MKQRPKGLQIELISGQHFYVGGEEFELSEIHNPTECTIKRLKDLSLFRLGYDTGTIIAPAVKVYVGTRGQGNRIRLLFDADRSIAIRRGPLP